MLFAIAVLGALGSIAAATFVSAAGVSSVASVVLTPQQFGAKGDGVSDDWWGFQQAINSAAARPEGGTVLVSNPPAGPTWRISQALRMRSRVTLRVPSNSTHIRCSGDADKSGPIDPTQGIAASLSQWPSYSCIMLGSYESNDYERLPIDAAAPLMAGAHEVVLANASSVKRYEIGDIVVIESTSTFTIGKRRLKPTWLQMNRVDEIDTPAARLLLRYPLQRSESSANVRRLTNTGLSMLNWNDKDTNVPMWASFDAAVIGGAWDAVQPHAPFMAGGGGLDCKLQPYSVRGYSGVGYGNLLARCNLSAAEETIRGIPLELAFGSHDNTVTLERVSITNELPQATPLKWLFALNEGAHANAVRIKHLMIGPVAVEDVILMDRAFGNKITVDTIAGIAITGSVVNLRSWNYVGTPPSTADNVAHVVTSAIGSQKAYVTIQGHDTTRNRVMKGDFSGAVQNQAGQSLRLIDAGPGNAFSTNNGSESEQK